MVIGLAGTYCAGKDTAAAVFEDAGWHLIDVDGLGHEALRAKRGEVSAAFGDSVLGESGEIDRRRLGAIVFSDPQALRRLERIVHPWMVESVREKIGELQGGNIVVNAAILFKMGLHSLCDAVVWVDAPWPVRFLRALRRDGFHPIRVMQRIVAQRGMRAQIRRENVDIYSIANTGARGALVAKVERLMESWPAGSPPVDPE
jgi:dephospho-CoA kinase